MNFMEEEDLWCIFQQCLGTFAMFLIEGTSEMGLVRHLSNHVLRVCNFGNTKVVRVISSFFSKYSKFNLDSKNGEKNSEKVFRFWDNCIWIGIVKFSLLRTGQFSSITNLLTRSPKIWHVNTRNFFDYKFPATDQLIWSRCYDADFNSVRTRLPYCLSKDLLKQDFSDI